MTDPKALREKLDATVQAYMTANYCGSTDATYSVALDLLGRLDAAEARVKALTAELDELLDELSNADAGIFAPISRDLRFKGDAALVDWNIAMDAAVNRRAALKLGGE